MSLRKLERRERGAEQISKRLLRMGFLMMEIDELEAQYDIFPGNEKGWRDFTDARGELMQGLSTLSSLLSDRLFDIRSEMDEVER